MRSRLEREVADPGRGKKYPDSTRQELENPWVEGMPEDWKRVCMGGSFAEVNLRKKCHSLMAISDYLKDDSIALVLKEFIGICTSLIFSFNWRTGHGTWVLQSKILFPVMKDEEISGKCSPFHGRNLNFICEICYNPFSAMYGCHSLSSDSGWTPWDCRILNSPKTTGSNILTLIWLRTIWCEF